VHNTVAFLVHLKSKKSWVLFRNANVLSDQAATLDGFQTVNLTCDWGLLDCKPVYSEDSYYWLSDKWWMQYVPPKCNYLHFWRTYYLHLQGRPEVLELYDITICKIMRKFTWFPPTSAGHRKVQFCTLLQVPARLYCGSINIKQFYNVPISSASNKTFLYSHKREL
jgi:hypothetical protein